jgi:hypothetical protein
VSSPSPLPACPRLCIDDLERICRDRASLSENERKRDVLCLSRFAFFRRASPPAQVIYARALDTVAKLGHRSTTFVLESLGFEACTRRHLLPKFGQKQISSRFSVLPCLCHVFRRPSDESHRRTTPPQHQLLVPLDAQHLRLHLCS